MSVLLQSERPRAQSLVEFALILPILILIILGVIEMGYALFIYSQVENAAREGARAAAVRPCPNAADVQTIIDATRARLPALVDTNSITPTISYGGITDPTYGNPVTVTVQYQFTLLDPLTTAFIPQITVNAEASRTLTTACGALSALPPTPIPTVLTNPDNGGNGNGGNGGGNDNGGTEPTVTPTVEPTPEPIDVTLLASKETNPNASGSAGNAARPLYLRVRVYRRYTGDGVAGRTVVVNIQRQGNVQTVMLGPTGADGYAQSCAAMTYRLRDQLTITTQQVENPPGGENGAPVTTSVDTTGVNICQ